MDSTAWHQGRRPPNPVGVVEMPYIEDLPSLPVSPGMHPVLKKGRGVVITTYEVDDMDMVVMDDGVGEELASSKSLLGSEGRAMTVPSFRDKLIGANGGLGDMQYISELDVEVREEDEMLPTEILDSIVAVPPLMVHYGTDTSGWRWSDKRDFSVGSAYSVLMGISERVRKSNWRDIWSLRVPQRVHVFMWLTTHRCHLTNIERVRRHLAFSDECTLCRSGPEDIDHVLRYYIRAWELWDSIIKPEVQAQFHALPFENWLHDNLHGSGIMVGFPMDWDHVDRDNVLARGQRLITECEERRQWLVRVCYVGRDRNPVADNLAALGRSQSMEGVVYAIPPSTLAVLAAEEKRRREDHIQDSNLVNQCSRKVDPRG
ncbi:hypothetical protein V6N13_064004 [Hibiscus sabdariffa]